MATAREAQNRPTPRRIKVELTQEQKAQLQQARREELANRHLMGEELRQVDAAASEPTFTGRLRCAVHRAPLLLDDLCQRAEIDLCLMGDFLRGEAALDSAAIDRLVAALGWPAVMAAEPTVGKANHI